MVENEKWDGELSHLLFLVELRCFHVQCLVEQRIALKEIWEKKQLMDNNDDNIQGL